MNIAQKDILLSIIIIMLTVDSSGGQAHGWRGPNRSGVYIESDLMKSWPIEGPPLVWEVSGIGTGFSSVTVVDDVIYITGKKDSVDVLTALSPDGKKKWETVYGKSWSNTYPESRCTPTFSNGKIFLVSGQGDLVCIGDNGKTIWSVNYFQKYNAKAPRNGISESPLVVDNKVIATPGGDMASMVAFNTENGKVIWECEPVNEETQYINPLLAGESDNKIIVTMTFSYVIGVDLDTGKLLWKINYAAENGDHVVAGNHTITPVYYDGSVFVTSGYNNSAMKFKLSDDGSVPEIIWKNTDIDPHVGGVIFLDNYLYSSTWDNNARGKWVCVDWKSGKTMWINEWYNKGSIISADGMIYIFEEKSGNVGLVKPGTEKLDVVSEFRITRGEGPYWSHPVINNGILYIRHGDVLMAFSIRQPQKV
jgi:outer membrane protein assembly factor BamB